MTIKDNVAIVFTEWGIPVVMVVVVVLATPNAYRAKTDFPSIDLVPASITAVRKAGTRRTDYFELRILHEDGRSFYHRDLERAPIDHFKSRIPCGEELRLFYQPTWGGNVLLEVGASRGPKETYLDFDTVMSAYRRRRLVVYAIAAIWFVGFSLLMIFKFISHAGGPSGTTTE